MKPDDPKSSTYISCSVENSDKDSKFEPVLHVRISIYKKICKWFHSKLIWRRFYD